MQYQSTLRFGSATHFGSGVVDGGKSTTAANILACDVMQHVQHKFSRALTGRLHDVFIYSLYYGARTPANTRAWVHIGLLLIDGTDV